MQKVYVLVKGDDEGYIVSHVLGIYSSRENAELALERYKPSYADIEERVIDQHIDQMRNGLSLWLVNIHKDGKMLGIWRDTHEEDPYFYVPHQRFLFTVWAQDKARAAEVADEVRVRILAGKQSCEQYPF